MCFFYLPYSREELLQVSWSYPGCQLHTEHCPSISLLWGQVIYGLPIMERLFALVQLSVFKKMRPSKVRTLNTFSFSERYNDN